MSRTADAPAPPVAPPLTPPPLTPRVTRRDGIAYYDTRIPGYTQHEPTMGEVRVEATITNAYDDYRAKSGLIEHREIRRVVISALVDTGAVRCCIPRRILEDLGADIFGELKTTFADGRRSMVPLSNALLIDVMGRFTFEDALVMGDEVLIGQTVLEKLDLWIDVKGQRVVGNPGHPDETITRQ